MKKTRIKLLYSELNLRHYTQAWLSLVTEYSMVLAIDQGPLITDGRNSTEMLIFQIISLK